MPDTVENGTKNFEQASNGSSEPLPVIAVALATFRHGSGDYIDARFGLEQSSSSTPLTDSLPHLVHNPPEGEETQIDRCRPWKSWCIACTLRVDEHQRPNAHQPIRRTHWKRRRQDAAGAVVS